MKKWKQIVALGTTLALSTSATACAANKNANVEGKVTTASDDNKNPNIVYIVLDDMGFSDLSSFGSTIETPNMDKLIENGIQYTNFFTTPLSSPSRAALLTGCEPNTVGMGATADIDFGELVPNINGRVTEEHPMISEILQDNGYNTFQVGKWHLGPYDEFIPDGDKKYWPSGRGFDKNYGFIASQTSMFEPGSMISGDEYIDVDFNKEGYHLTNDLVDTTLSYVSEAIKEDPSKSNFVYFAPGAMHSPLQAPQEYIDMYKGKYNEGWDVEREKRFEKQKELGIFDENAELPERNPNVPAWDDLTEDEKKVASKHMEVYAGYLKHTDDQIGRLIDGFKEMGIYDDTIFVLMADNGSNPHGGVYGNPNGHAVENTYYRTLDEQLEIMDEFGGKQYGSGYNTGWAMASNTPYRMYKYNAFYGGVKTPLIISWENGIKEQNRISEQLVDVTDITPTMLDILDIEFPEENDGVKTEPMQGMSFYETFESSKPVENGRDEIYVHMATDRAISIGDGFIAVTNPNTGEWELFDMEKDPTQAHNIAAEHPEKVEELKKLHSEIQKEHNAQNFVMDMLLSTDMATMKERYGEELTSNVMNCLTKGAEPATEEVAKIVQALKVCQIDNNRGSILYIPESSKLYGKEFTYTKDMGYFSSLAGARTNAVSHEIKIAVSDYKQGDEGVLFSNGGGYDGGYSFYIKDGKLNYVYNFTGERQKLTSNVNVPQGSFEVGFKYEKENLFEGKATLMIDGKEVAKSKIRTLPMFTSYDYMCVGKDVGSKVSTDYNDNFEFTGEVGEVKVIIGDDIAEKNERPEW